MSAPDQPARLNPAITLVGWLHLAHGMVFVALGAWCLIGGTDAVLKSLAAGQAVGDLGKKAPGLTGDQAGKMAAGADLAGKGLAGAFAFLAGIAAGCFIVNGLPLCLVGAGVINRWGWARVCALILAALSGVQGLGLLLGTAATPNVRVLGGVLTAFAVVTWAVLIGKHAVAEFSLGRRAGIEAAAASHSPALTAAGVLLVVAPLAAVVYVAAWPSGSPDAKKEARKDALGEPVSVAAFHAAAAKGQLSRVVECLRGGVLADDRDEKNETALMHAAARGQSRLAMLLLSMGADPNEKDEAGRTPLMMAAEEGHGAIVTVLLGKADAVNMMREFRDSLFPGVEIKIPTLKKDGKIDIGKIDLPRLPTLMALPKAEVDSRDRKGQTALMLAARGGHSDVVRALTQAGADKDVVDREGMKAWMHAGANGHAEVMETLLPGGSRPATYLAKNRQGKTVYELAAAAGHANVVEVMKPHVPEEIKKAALAPPLPPKEDVPGKWAKMSPALAKAVEGGDHAEAERLIRERAALAEGRDEKGRTALHLAAERGDAKMLLLLTAALGPTRPEMLDAVDVDKKTALMVAAAGGHVEAVDALLIGVRGAWSRGRLHWFRHVERKDGDGKTAAAIAAEAKKPAVAEKIEAFGVEMLDLESDGHTVRYAASTSTKRATALMWAAEEGDVASVEALLARGAKRQLALQIAAYKGHVLVVKAVLQSFGDSAARLSELRFEDRDYGNDPAPMLAHRAGHKEVAALLFRERELAEKAAKEAKPAPPTLPTPKSTIPPALARAIAEEDLDKLQAHLDGGDSLSGADPQGRTALMLACAKGNRRVVLLLGAKMRTTGIVEQTFTQDKAGQTALHHAALGGQAGVVESILVTVEAAWDDGKLNWFAFLDHKDKEGKTAIDLAKEKKHAAAEAALAAGMKALLNRPSKTYRATAVEESSERGDLALVERLLACGASVQTGFLHKPGERAATALARAARRGHTAVVKRLLASFGDDQEKRVKYLREGEGNDAWECAAWAAAMNGKSAALQAVLEGFGKDTKGRVEHLDKEGNILHRAVYAGHLLAVQMLLEALEEDKAVLAKKVDLRARYSGSAEQRTPLWIATDRGHKEIAALLRKHGATKEE